MPKPVKNLWEPLLSWENLVLAAHEAARHKRTQDNVLRYNARLEENLLDLRERLRTRTWRPGPFNEFTVYEPKMRLVQAPCYPDRVLHHALAQQIGPPFERRFICASYACRAGKGPHAASARLTDMLRSAAGRWDTVYVLKADISKYFYSIDHERLLRVVPRTIGDPHVLDLIQTLVTKCPVTGDRGLPLGALTSQLLANGYLDQLDHYCKEALRLKYYVRYMDDFVVLGPEKTALWRLLDEIRDFLAVEYHLSLNPKTRVFPASHGVDFAGYRHWTTHKLPRKRTLRRAARRFRGLSRLYAAGRVSLDTVRSSVASFAGYIKHCKGWRSAGSALEGLVLVKVGGDGEESECS